MQSKGKAKINLWYFSKWKSFCMGKETTDKMKRQPTDWEKISTNTTSDKELTPKIYKELHATQYQNNQTTQLNHGQKVWTIFQRRHLDAKRYMKRHSTSLRMWGKGNIGALPLLVGMKAEAVTMENSTECPQKN